MSKTIVFDRYKTMTSITKGDLQGDKKRTLVNDDMKADGVMVEWFKSPSKNAPETNETTAHRGHYEATKAAVINAFDGPDRKLHDTPAHDLEPGNLPGQRGAAKRPARGTRRYIKQQVSTRVGQFAKSYATYLTGPAEKGPDGRTNDLTFCKERSVAMRKRLEKAENASFDVIEAQAVLVQFEKILNTKV